LQESARGDEHSFFKQEPQIPHHQAYRYSCYMQICKLLPHLLKSIVHVIWFITKSRAGTIRSSAVSLRIRYGPCRYDTYSIRYTCTRLKVSKSRILDFNNKVNVLDWSIQWILQILVLLGPESSLFLQLSPSSVSVQHDGRIDMYRLMSVSILYRYWLYRPSPNKQEVRFLLYLLGQSVT